MVVTHLLFFQLINYPHFPSFLLRHSSDVVCIKILKMFLQKPLFVSRSVESYLTTGCWSPSRPGVIYIGLIDGSIEVWDLLDHSHQPSLVASIGSCQVTSMEFCASRKCISKSVIGFRV
jgi:WD40 repeat protein